MPAFVIKYHRKSGAYEVFPFEESFDGLRKRFALERENEDPDVEIVSITARNLDDVKRTHSRYFMKDGSGLSV